jgi:ubiquinone/menaquinone biosynthesis C-methylase UbiE
MNLSGVSRKNAFLGSISTAVRKKAWELCHGQETILEVCCGNGLFFLHSKTKDAGEKLLIGIDKSEELLHEAKKIFLDNSIEKIGLIRGDAFQLPFKNKMFDRVVCINTFLNLPSLATIEALITELTRVCKGNGRLVIETRNSANPYIRLKYWLHVRKQNFPVKTYRVKNISHILERHGFSCTEILPIGCPCNLFAKAFLIVAGRKKQT